MRYGSKRGWLEDSLINIRVLTIDSDLYKILRDTLHEEFGDEARRIFYNIGFCYGKIMGSDILNMGASNLEVYRKFLERGRSHGYGDFSTPYLKLIVSGLRGKPAIALIDSFFAHSAGKTGEPECHIIAGMIAGAACVVLKQDEIFCVEEKCLSKGDECCEFKLERKHMVANFDTCCQSNVEKEPVSPLSQEGEY